MSERHVFERNMLAIASWHGPACADRIRSAEASPDFGVAQARDGGLVPYVERGGRKAFLHSRIEPKREAARLSERYAKPGFYAFLGMGACYQIEALLDAGRVTRGLVVEYDAALARALLESVDLTHILGDRRLKLLIDPNADELDEALTASYVPALTGDFVSVPLRGRIDLDPESFSSAADAIRGTISIISDDYSVQSFFGKRWFSNIVRNLESAALPTPPVGPISRAMVTAAGPSLEASLGEIARRPKGTYLIATDTSLRALIEAGIKPDAVVSIDCQHISYYHFSLGLPRETALFVDLASPPTVTRLASKPYYFSSGHPLSRYIASRFRAFPVVDTSGGNVTHAAVSLASYLGASSIAVYGADYSYPFGKSYARGTYIYPYFDLRQSRSKPFEALFSDFLYRNQSLDRELDDDGGYRYVTKPLVMYRERFEKLAASLPCSVERIRGRGVVTDFRRREPVPRSRQGKVFAAGRAFQSPAAFLSSYLGDIEALPEPFEQAASYLDGLSPHEKDVWTTMLPSAAAYRRERGDSPPAPVELLAMTRDWCAGIVRDELSRTGGAAVGGASAQ